MSDELTYIAYAALVAGLLGLLANFSIGRHGSFSKILLLTITFAPALAIFVLIIIKKSNPTILLMLALFAGLPLAGVMLGGSGSPFRIGRKSATLIGFPVLIALGCALTSMNMTASKRAERIRLERDRNIAQWHQAEARLKECARTLTEKLGVDDARANHAHGDRRLYAVTSYGQEMSSTSVPGIETGSDGFSGFYGYVTGRAPGDRQNMAYGVENSPKGQIWSDPWGYVSGSMGREPPSAKPCTDATGRYVNAYNATMLALGVLRKGVVPRTELVPARMQSIGVIWGLYDSFDRNETRADYLANLLRSIDVLAIRPGILTQADVDLDMERSLAMSLQASTFQVMGFDRNDDGVVTREEIERVAATNKGKSFNPRLLDRYDLNDDGRITKAEIGEAVAEWEGSDNYDESRVRAIVDLDPNHDGQLTAAELTMLGKRAFATVDKDGDGVISPQEYEITDEARWKASREADRRAIEKYGPVCRMPVVPQGAKIIYVAVYQGQRSGPFVINGQPMDAQIIDVHITPGREALYLILRSFERIMWKFSGATDRVAMAVLSSSQTTGLDKSAAAAAPIPDDKIFVLRGKCRDAFYHRSRGLIRRSLGRQPDRIITNYELDTVTLP